MCFYFGWGHWASPGDDSCWAGLLPNWAGNAGAESFLSGYFFFQPVSNTVGKERGERFSFLLLLFRMRMQRLLVGLDGTLSYLGKLKILYTILKPRGTNPEFLCKWNKGTSNVFTSRIDMWGRHTFTGKHTTYMICNILGYLWQNDCVKVSSCFFFFLSLSISLLLTLWSYSSSHEEVDSASPPLDSGSGLWLALANRMKLKVWCAHSEPGPQ